MAKEQCPAFYVPGICGVPSAAWGTLSSYCALCLYQGLVPQTTSSPLQPWVHGQLSHWWDSYWAPAGCSSDTAACILGQATFAGMSQLASGEQPPPCFFTHPSLQGVSADWLWLGSRQGILQLK